MLFSVDNTPPSIQCPANQQTTLCQDTSSQFTWTIARATDNCGAARVVYSATGATNFNSQSQNSARFNVGQTFMTATATDDGGRSATCQFSVSVNGTCFQYRWIKY